MEDDKNGWRLEGRKEIKGENNWEGRSEEEENTMRLQVMIRLTQRRERDGEEWATGNKEQEGVQDLSSLDLLIFLQLTGQKPLVHFSNLTKPD